MAVRPPQAARGQVAQCLKGELNIPTGQQTGKLGDIASAAGVVIALALGKRVSSICTVIFIIKGSQCSHYPVLCMAAAMPLML